MYRRALPLIALIAPLAAEASAPPLVPVTGYLTDATGAPLNDQVTMQLKMYRTVNGSQSVWEELQQVQVDNGQFTVYLGQASPLGLDLFKTNATLYLGVAINNGVEMAPRFQVATAPYAGYAQYCDDANSVGGILPGDIRLTTDATNWSDISGIPASLADGDQDTLYTNGTGLSLTTSHQFSVDQTTIEGWARGVSYDSLTELRAVLDSVYMAKQTCATQQVLASDGAGSWVCTDTTSLPISETLVDQAVANNGYLTASSLTSINTAIATAQGDISALQSSSTSQGSAITTLQGTVTTLSGSVTTLQGQISGISGNPGNMIAQYEFDEGTGATSFADTSGLSNTLSANSGGVGAGSGTAHSGKSVAFNTIEGIFAAANNKIPDSAQIYPEMWIRTGDPSQNYTLLDKQGAYKLRMVGGKIEWTVSTAGGTCTITHGTSITNNTWSLVSGWYDGLNVGVIVNGVTQVTPCAKGRITPTIGGVMTIGGKLTSSTWSEQFSGNIDEVRIRPTAPGGGNGYYAYGTAVPYLPVSTGGTITTSGPYKIHTFTSSGTFTAGGAGGVELLVVAGGGSGGNHSTTNANGGGGGGGVIYKEYYPIAAGGPITVTVGAGGARIGHSTNSRGNKGGNSAFGSLVAYGGGGGGSSGSAYGEPGGSGGGGAYNYSIAGAGTNGQGNSGGNSSQTWTGGGGGGAGTPGENGYPGSAPAGNGGFGITSSISGSVAYYGGGGGGSGNSSERAGDGYDGGGRGCGTTSQYNWNNYPAQTMNGTTHGSSTPDALPNTGGGGGAGSYWAANGGWGNGSGAGGSGIVIVRYIP